MGVIRHAPTSGVSPRRRRWCLIQHGAVFVFYVCAGLSFWVAFLWLLLTLTGDKDNAEHPSVASPVFAGFTVPLVQTLYVQASYLLAGLCVIVVVFAFNAVTWMLPSARVAHALSAILGVLVSVCIAFVVLVVLATQSSAQFSRLIDARDAVVNATFSEFYCQARVTKLCASSSDGHRLTKLTQVFDGLTVTPTSNSSASLSGSEAMANVFFGCQHVLITSQGGLSVMQQVFLTSVNTSDTVDSWCGSYLLRQVYSDGSESSISPEVNPVSINTHVLDLFVSSWSNRIFVDAFLLAGILSAWIIAMVVSWVKIPFAEKAYGSAANDISYGKYALAASGVQEEEERAERR